MIFLRIFDKLKHSIYDLFGFIIPGFIALFMLIPILYYNDSFLKVTPIDFLINLDPSIESDLNVLNYLNLNFSDAYMSVFLIFVAYLLGHLLRFLGKLLFKIPYINIFSLNALFLKNHDDKFDKLLIKAQSLTAKKFDINLNNKNDKAWIDEYLNKFTLSFGRSTTYLNSVNNMLVKYISKYNFYVCLCFLFFMLTLNTYMVIFNLNPNLFVVFIILIILFVFFAISKINSKKEVSSAVSWLLLTLHLFNSIMSGVFISKKVGFTLFIVFFMYLCFEFEYFRHLKLSRKEALYAIVHTYSRD